MHAIVVSSFGDPSVLELKTDVPIPTPGPGQVVVEIKAVGVNPVDTYIRSGTYGAAVKPPYTPGTDSAGVVHQVGEGVTRVQKGDRVYTARTITGSYAQYALCDADNVHPLPDKVTFGQGAAVYVPYATAYRALVQKARARPGQTVLVHGASGGVGVAAVQIARALGLRVIGTASTPEGRDLILREGAHYAFNHKEEDYLQKINQLTDGGADVVLEMLANVNLQKDLELGVRRDGFIVVIGSRGDINVTPRFLMTKECFVTGVALLSSTPAENREQHAYIGAGLANGTLRPIVGKELPLVDAPKAHHEVINSSAFGKLVLLPW